MSGVEEVVNHLLYLFPFIQAHTCSDTPSSLISTTNGLLLPHKPLKAKRLYQLWCLPRRHQLCYRLTSNRTQFEATCAMTRSEDDVLPAGRFAEDGVGVR